MYVQLLGPVEASVEGRPVAIGSGKPRALLALLALHARSVVPADRLIEGLWGEEPPATAHKLVQLHVSQLRKAFAENGNAAQIVTRGQGYELDIDAAQVDAQWFERLVELGEAREALALWHGPPLHDVAGEPFAAAEIRRLEELRLTALENAIERDLAAGRHREVVGELDGLVREEPLRERLHAQRMLALYRSGRQADALDAYRQARTALVEEIGVEPGPELRRLHDEILRQDPSLHRAAEAVVEAAERVAAGRPALRAAEDELVGGIVAVQAARGSAIGGKDGLVLPLQGPRLVRRRRRGLLLRPRAPRRRAGRAADGRAAHRPRRRLREREVLAAARRLVASLAAGVLPGSDRWAIALLRPGAHPMRALEEATAEAAPTGRAPARRRPVRGAVHRVPRRGGALLVRRRARRVGPRPAPARGRAPGDPRRLLRALRRLPRAGAPARGQSRPRRADAARRAAAGDRAAGGPRRAARSSRRSRTRCSPASRASRARCRCCRPRCSSCGSAATATCCGSPTTRSSAGSRARSRAWRSARTSGSHRSSARWRGASCCAS